MTGHLPGRHGANSLPEVFASIRIPTTGHAWRRLFAFVGPGFMVSVGYMDPGNWATDLAGGSRYGFALLWVILLSNLMAMLLQSLCVRLGIVTQMDLAQACRQIYSKPVSVMLWLLCEIAIIACDLAEVVGSAVALNLLFGIPLVVGVLITSADVLLLLGLMRFGFRKLEAIIFVLVSTVGFCFAYQLFLSQPSLPGIARGFVVPSLPDRDALLISIGILGATVMPHNLYLHSSIVQTRQVERNPEKIREAIRWSTWDVIVALAAALFVNAAILILAAAVFNKGGHIVEELGQAHELLRPALGGAAATAFAVALLASGQSATITGTLAGQIVMEGFLNLRIQPWLRRLITRSLAIIPAVILVSASGGKGTVELLVLSQVVLSMQLSFAAVPLVMMTSSRKLMGEFVNSTPVAILGAVTVAIIAGLNLWLLQRQFGPLYFGLGVAVMALAFGIPTLLERRRRAATPAAQP